MKKLKSVYQRMYKDKKLFFLGYGVLYITEMRRVKNLTEIPELRIKSQELAETWFKLFKKYNLLPRKDSKIHSKNGVYTFCTSALSIYDLINEVKRLPENEMDSYIRKRIANFTYTGKSPLNKNRIKILKALKEKPFLTNELGRKINFSLGNVLRRHILSLVNIGYVKRKNLSRGKIQNSLTKKGDIFISNFIKNIDNIPIISVFDECLKNKQLASDLMLLIYELEMGAVMERSPYLQMKSKDFVTFIFNVCKKWNWTDKDSIKKRTFEKYDPVYYFYLNSRSIDEIYSLSGPCCDSDKNNEFIFATSLRKPGSHRKIGQTKQEILKLIENNINTVKQLSFKLKISPKNVRAALNDLTKQGKLIKIKINKGYKYKLK